MSSAPPARHMVYIGDIGPINAFDDDLLQEALLLDELSGGSGHIETASYRMRRIALGKRSIL